MQRLVERALLDEQHVLGAVVDGLGDRVAVRGSEFKGDQTSTNILMERLRASLTYGLSGVNDPIVIGKVRERARIKCVLDRHGVACATDDELGRESGWRLNVGKFPQGLIGLGTSEQLNLLRIDSTHDGQCESSTSRLFRGFVTGVKTFLLLGCHAKLGCSRDDAEDRDHDCERGNKTAHLQASDRHYRLAIEGLQMSSSGRTDFWPEAQRPPMGTAIPQTRIRKAELLEWATFRRHMA